MPSNPRSSLELLGSELRRDATSMNTLELATLFVLSNTRTCPVFCTTYQRALLPGACSIAMGCVKVRFGNTRCKAIDTDVPGASPARHAAFAGRASSPEVGGGGGGGGVPGGGLASPPPHVTSASDRTAKLTDLRTARPTMWISLRV